MATVRLPSLMRDLTGGKETVSMPGRTVGEVIDALDEVYPGVKKRLFTGERLDPALRVAVDGKVVRRGLSEAIGERSKIRFLPVVAGG